MTQKPLDNAPMCGESFPRAHTYTWWADPGQVDLLLVVSETTAGREDYLSDTAGAAQRDRVSMWLEL